MVSTLVQIVQTTKRRHEQISFITHYFFSILQYLRWRPKVALKQKIQARCEELVAIEVSKKDMFDATRTSKRGMVCEVIIILFSLSVVPILVLIVYGIWPV